MTIIEKITNNIIQIAPKEKLNKTVQKNRTSLDGSLESFLQKTGEANFSQIDCRVNFKPKTNYISSLNPNGYNKTKKKNGITGLIEKVSAFFYKKDTQKLLSFIDGQNEKFYSIPRKQNEIYYFEKNKGILKALCEIKPEEAAKNPREYKALLKEIMSSSFKENEIEEIFKRNNAQRLYDKLHSSWSDTTEHGFSAKIFYSQKELLNPDLENFEKQICETELELTRKIRASKAKYSINIDEIEKILKESRNLTLNDGSFLKDYYGDKEFYDLPVKFATASYNTLQKEGSAYINNNVREIFKDTDEKELFKAFDLFSAFTKRNTNTYPEGSIINLKIQGKDYQLEALKHGLEGSVYKIRTADNKNSAILKVFYTNSDHSSTGVTFAPAGLYGTIGILREANLAKVVNVPKLYAANPILKPVQNADGKFAGGWCLVEDAAQKETLSSGLKIQDWLKSKGLIMRDNKEDAWVNGTLVDLGFIGAPNEKSMPHAGWGDSRTNEIYSKYLNNETTDDIINFLQKIQQNTP